MAISNFLASADVVIAGNTGNLSGWVAEAGATVTPIETAGLSGVAAPSTEPTPVILGTLNVKTKEPVLPRAPVVLTL